MRPTSTSSRRATPRDLWDRHGDSAYALACEVVAADRFAQQPMLRMLEFVVGELRLDPLVASAIERAARARHQRVERPV